MPEVLVAYVRWIDAINRHIGRLAMYLILVLIGDPALCRSLQGVFGVGPIWSVEMASFTLAAIYMLGGAYSLQTGGHVRMDLFYGDGRREPARSSTASRVLGLLLYLGVLLFGAVESTAYAFETGAAPAERMGSAAMADPAGDDDRHLLDAAPGDRHPDPRHCRDPRRSASHELRDDRRVDVRWP